jgi:NADH-quinone oxidoreductase subunit A
MSAMATLVFVLVVFLVVSVFFLFIHLMMGKFIRPARPDVDKLTIYECGEPTVGSAWIQFDLRYYVVALLFVIFDVEVAFFFPWATTFGKANDLARTDLDKDKRAAISKQLIPQTLPAIRTQRRIVDADTQAIPAERRIIDADDALNFAWIAMLDIVVFFGVLLVGFAYLWKRGDIDWVRTVAAERQAEPTMPAPLLPKPVPAGTLAGAGALQH